MITFALGFTAGVLVTLGFIAITLGRAMSGVLVACLNGLTK